MILAQFCQAYNNKTFWTLQNIISNIYLNYFSGRSPSFLPPSICVPHIEFVFWIMSSSFWKSLSVVLTRDSPKDQFWTVRCFTWFLKDKPGLFYRYHSYELVPERFHRLLHINYGLRRGWGQLLLFSFDVKFYWSHGSLRSDHTLLCGSLTISALTIWASSRSSLK